MNDTQRQALQALSDRYNVEFDEDDWLENPFDLPAGYVAGWIGGSQHIIYVGCSSEGEISS